jgi:uncharacterized protein YqgV (UPF0045/DUF77 family)
MINAVEEFPGQIRQLEGYITILEKEQSELLQTIKQMRERVAELESQVFGGTTK